MKTGKTGVESMLALRVDFSFLINKVFRNQSSDSNNVDEIIDWSVVLIRTLLVNIYYMPS